MPFSQSDKIQAEHRLREFLRSNDLPQPDEVEYGYACVRFLFHEPKACIVFDLEADADEATDAHLPSSA